MSSFGRFVHAKKTTTSTSPATATPTTVATIGTPPSSPSSLPASSGDGVGGGGVGVGDGGGGAGGAGGDGGGDGLAATDEATGALETGTPSVAVAADALGKVCAAVAASDAASSSVPETVAMVVSTTTLPVLSRVAIWCAEMASASASFCEKASTSNASIAMSTTNTRRIEKLLDGSANWRRQRPHRSGQWTPPSKSQIWVAKRGS